LQALMDAKEKVKNWSPGIGGSTQKNFAKLNMIWTKNN